MMKRGLLTNRSFSIKYEVVGLTTACGSFYSHGVAGRADKYICIYSYDLAGSTEDDIFSIGYGYVVVTRGT